MKAKKKGAEKFYYDLLAAMVDGEKVGVGEFQPPKGSPNQRALYLATRAMHAAVSPRPLADDERAAILRHYRRENETGLMGTEPNSSEYHHLHAAAAWSVLHAAWALGDEELAAEARYWCDSDVLLGLLCTAPAADSIVSVPPGSRCFRRQSLSRDILCQRASGLRLSRNTEHEWWNYRERRESLGPHLAVRTNALRRVAKQGRTWGLRGLPLDLVSCLRLRSPMIYRETTFGWSAWFPRLADCWDNARPAVTFDGERVHVLQSRDPGERRTDHASAWHTSDVVVTQREGQLVATGQAYRRDRRGFLWQDAIPIALGRVVHEMIIGPDGVTLDGRRLTHGDDPEEGTGLTPAVLFARSLHASNLLSGALAKASGPDDRVSLVGAAAHARRAARFLGELVG